MSVFPADGSPESFSTDEGSSSPVAAHSSSRAPLGAAMDAMVWIPGGTFLMGSDRHYPEEGPAHKVTVDGFWMDRYPVTNRQFKEFVRATKHVTVAEITPD